MIKVIDPFTIDRDATEPCALMFVDANDNSVLSSASDELRSSTVIQGTLIYGGLQPVKSGWVKEVRAYRIKENVS